MNSSSLLESLRELQQELSEQPLSHSLLHRAASRLDLLGRRLHGLALKYDRQIARCLSDAIEELAACHPLVEAERAERLKVALRQLEEATEWLKEGELEGE